LAAFTIKLREFFASAPARPGHDNPALEDVVGNVNMVHDLLSDVTAGKIDEDKDDGHHWCPPEGQF